MVQKSQKWPKKWPKTQIKGSCLGLNMTKSVILLKSKKKKKKKKKKKTVPVFSLGIKEYSISEYFEVITGKNIDDMGCWS